MTTHLELDILECEVQWTIGSITTNKAGGSDRITAELLKFFKDDAVKCCTQHVNKCDKSAVATGLEKVSFHSNTKKRAIPKNVQTTVQPHSFHMLARIHSKSFKLDFCSMWTNNIQMIQAGFQRGTRGQIVSIHWMVEKAREFQKKKIYVCFTEYQKAFDCVDPNKTVENYWDENTRPPYLPPEMPVCRSRSNS